MTMQNIESKWWNKTHLSPELQLDEVEIIDEAFQDVYLASLAFSKLLLPNSNYEAVENEYISGVKDFNGDVESIEGLKDELWAGYHPVVLMLSRLKWYGKKGIYHYSDSNSPDNSEALRHEITLGRSFLSLMAPAWISYADNGSNSLEGNIFEQIVNAAEARYALDSGENLSFEQVVILSGMSRRAVQNDAAKAGPASLKVNANEVKNSDAHEWLRERRNFIPTSKFGEEAEQKELETENCSSNSGDFVFVPVTDDGVAFLPELRREGGFEIGKYGDEEYYRDYYEALTALQTMDVPKFRRPNSQGTWGIKVSTGWRRVPKHEIDAEIQSI